MSQIKPKVLVGNCCVLQKPSERKLWWMGFDKKQDQPLLRVTLISRLTRAKRAKLKIPKKILQVVSGRRLPSRWNRSWTKERGWAKEPLSFRFFLSFFGWSAVRSKEIGVGESGSKLKYWISVNILRLQWEKRYSDTRNYWTGDRNLILEKWAKTEKKYCKEYSLPIFADP